MSYIINSPNKAESEHMDYSNYEIYDFDHVSSFNMSTGYAERSYKAHWHSYGEILLVGPEMPNIYCVG